MGYGAPTSYHTILFPFSSCHSDSLHTLALVTSTLKGWDDERQIFVGSASMHFQKLKYLVIFCLKKFLDIFWRQKANTQGRCIGVCSELGEICGHSLTSTLQKVGGKPTYFLFDLKLLDLYLQVSCSIWSDILSSEAMPQVDLTKSSNGLKASIELDVHSVK